MELVPDNGIYALIVKSHCVQQAIETMQMVPKQILGGIVPDFR